MPRSSQADGGQIPSSLLAAREQVPTVTDFSIIQYQQFSRHLFSQKMFPENEKYQIDHIIYTLQSGKCKNYGQAAKNQFLKHSYGSTKLVLAFKCSYTI